MKKGSTKPPFPPRFSKHMVMGIVVVVGIGAVLGGLAWSQRTRVLALFPASWRTRIEYPNAQTLTIRRTTEGFTPMTVTITEGDTVRFENQTDQFMWPASDIHPTHEVYPEFDPKRPVAPHDSWSFQFTNVGRWNLHDHLAPMWTGSINVQARNPLTTTPVTPNPLQVADAAQVQHWRDQIATQGADVTYQQLKQHYQDKTYGEQHTAAHAFGTALYLEKGINGIGTCDDSFGFGCYHTFFGTAIQREGEGIIKKLDQACIDRWGKLGLGCQHGIGHGILAAFGYQRLNDALRACQTLEWQGDFGGCSGGVFMEYNVQSMNAERPGLSREPNTALHEPDRYFDPCPQVIDKYRAACYFEISQWWLALFPHDVRKAGQLCAALPATASDLERQACYRGIGKNNVPERLHDVSVQQVITDCGLMPTTTAAMHCREGSIWTFFSGEQQAKEVQQLCTQGISSEVLRTECLQYQQKVHNGQ